MALVPIVRAAHRAPLGGDSGKWLPKSGAQSSKNNTITYFYSVRTPVWTIPKIGHHK
jgi:hypothetical protein